MRKRYIEEHNDADSEPGDQLSVADSQTQTQMQNGKSSVVVPLNPEMLTKKPFVISTSKRSFNQTNKVTGRIYSN